MPVFSVTLANLQIQLAIEVDEFLEVPVPQRFGTVAHFSRRNDFQDQVIRPAKFGLTNKLMLVVRSYPALQGTFRLRLQQSSLTYSFLYLDQRGAVRRKANQADVPSVFDVVADLVH